MFPGNVTAQLQAGTYYLGVFGQGSAGDECSFTVLAKASNRTVLPHASSAVCKSVWWWWCAESSLTFCPSGDIEPNVTALVLGVNTTGTAMAQGWTYYSLSYMAPVRGTRLHTRSALLGSFVGERSYRSCACVVCRVSSALTQAC